MNQTCPSCSQPAAGRYCSHCGTPLETPATCRECSAELLPEAGFCNQCGAPVAAAPEPAAADAHAATGDSDTARPASNLPWYIAGAALVVLIAVVLLPRLQDEPSAAPPPFAAAPAASEVPMGDARSVDLASMTPRQAADRLFQRVMRSVSSGDTVQAGAFLPMALDAYARVPELDDDARYHLGTLHLLAGNPSAARAQADTILDATPTHLFGLFVAAKAEEGQGNAGEARSLYRRFLEVYTDEVARDRPEYQAHAPAMPGMRAEAEAGVRVDG